MMKSQEKSWDDTHHLPIPWWRHQIETFSALMAICAGNSPVPGEFTAQRPVTQSFDVFFDLHPNKRLSKQWWGWWFETPSCPLRRHRNAYYYDSCLSNKRSDASKHNIIFFMNVQKCSVSHNKRPLHKIIISTISANIDKFQTFR